MRICAKCGASFSPRSGRYGGRQKYCLACSNYLQKPNFQCQCKKCLRKFVPGKTRRKNRRELCQECNDRKSARDERRCEAAQKHAMSQWGKYLYKNGYYTPLRYVGQDEINRHTLVLDSILKGYDIKNTCCSHGRYNHIAYPGYYRVEPRCEGDRCFFAFNVDGIASMYHLTKIYGEYEKERSKKFWDGQDKRTAKLRIVTEKRRAIELEKQQAATRVERINENAIRRLRMRRRITNEALRRTSKTFFRTLGMAGSVIGIITTQPQESP